MRRSVITHTIRFMYKKYVGVALCLFGPFLTGLPCLYAQLPATTRDVQQAAAYQARYENTLRSAYLKGWPLREAIGSGRIISLQRTDALGEPVYYTTHSTPVSVGTHTDALYQGGSLGLNMNGSSNAIRNKIAMWDGGRVRGDHRELNGKVNQSDLSTSAVFSNHATHLAGIMVGRGVELKAKGMAFGADLQVWDFDNDLSEIVRQAPTLLLSNHAYGPVAGWVLDTSRPGTSNDEKWEWWGTPAISGEQDYRFGFYDEAVSEIDRITKNFPYFLMVRSADNKRTENGPPPGVKYYLKNTNIQSTLPRSRNDAYDVIPGEANAKNVLTVGAAELRNATYELSTYSGWGPTDDGRIKPDLLGVGSNVLSSVGASTEAYGVLSGTSMASANVTGSLLLLQELYQQRTGAFMLSSSLKGLVLHTADKPPGSIAPSYAYGWGLLNTEKAARALLNKDGSYLLAENVLRQGGIFTQKIVASGTQPLVVTICWTDPEAVPTEVNSRNVNNTSPKLVNDLDVVLQEGFNAYKPWVLDPALPAQKAQTGNNIRDNVEQVYIPNPVKGRSYTLTISHKYTLKNGQQPFSLIVSGIQQADCELAALLSPGATDTTLCAGQTLTLAANAGNTIEYEWFQNGTSIKKGTERHLDVSKAGTYTVRASAPGCSAISRPIIVRNTSLYADIAQKGTVVVCDSKGVELSSNTGTGYTYQWLLNGTPVPGALSPQARATTSGRYQVRINHRGCSALSAETQVEMTPVSASLLPASSAAICNGRPAELNVPKHNGATYAWFYNNNLITSATTPGYLAALAGRYSVEVRNGSCKVRSTDVIVQKVEVVASITTPPVNQITTEGGLLLNATYALGNRYAWHRNDSLMKQETSPQLTVRSGGRYYVIIENSGCKAQSGTVTLWGNTDVPLVTGSDPPLNETSVVVLSPNPAQETVVVTLQRVVPNSDARAELVTLAGQTLLSQPLLPVQGAFKTLLDVRTLPVGSYLIKISLGGHSSTYHFVKQ